MSILLIGYRGTGKTTVARLLAEQLAWSLVEADEQIERQAGKSIREIFEQDGESKFRELESALIRSLTGRTEAVISLGGGAVLLAENRSMIQDHQHVVWLRANANTIAARLADDSTTAERRPNLTPHGGLQEIQLLLEQREPLYRQCATLMISTEGMTPPAIAEEILQSTGFQARQ